MSVPSDRQSGVSRLGVVQMTSEGPFAVGSALWRDARGRLVCTLVAKATYELGPGICGPVSSPLPLQLEDRHREDDPGQSISSPSDMALFKAAAEVVVVGSAFAADDQPTSSLAARIAVGPVDKRVIAWAQRWFRADASIEESPRLTRFPLGYEHAAGGPETDNPVGVDPHRVDARGRRAIPRLLPLSYELGNPGEHIPSVGLGPIAPGWPSRRKHLSEQDLTWLRGAVEYPQPISFPPRFFQSAPMDQWITGSIAPNERIVLEGMHDGLPRLVATLSGLEPWAIVTGAKEEQIRLIGDLLVIDTDRCLATLTFRGQLTLVEGAGPARVSIVGVPLGAHPTPDGRLIVHRALDPQHAMAGATPDTTMVQELDDDEISLDLTSAESPERDRAFTLPFARRAAPPEPRALQPSFGGSALPFREAGPRQSTPPPPPPRWEPIAAAPIFMASAPAPIPPAPIAPAPAAPEPFRPAVVTAPPAAPPAIVMPEPARSSPPRLAPNRRAAAPARGATGGRKPPGAAGGLKASSDAAADRERGREATAARPPTSRPESEPLRRRAVIDLLSFEPKIAPRLRGLQRFAPVWVQPPRARSVQGLDEPRPEPASRERADVLRLLSCASPDNAASIRGTLASCLDDLHDFDPPLLLLAGELRPTFDEVEILRATLSIALTIAGMDKKILAVIALAQQALAPSDPPRPEVAIGLSRQLEQAASSLSLPPRYLASQVERVLLESRKFKRRTLLGAPRVRADLVIARDGEVWPLYLPDAVATSLPLLLSYPVMVLCEVRPREDLAEAHAEALFAMALGRVLLSRADS